MRLSEEEGIGELQYDGVQYSESGKQEEGIWQKQEEESSHL